MHIHTVSLTRVSDEDTRKMDLAYLITCGFVGHRTVECFTPPGRETKAYNLNRWRRMRGILHKANNTQELVYNRNNQAMFMIVYLQRIGLSELELPHKFLGITWTAEIHPCNSFQCFLHWNTGFFSRGFVH